MTEPTDADLRALLPMKLLERDKPPKVQVWLTQKDAFAFARAVLAKWGTPPAVAGEPVAWRHRMGPTDIWVECSKEFHDWVVREPSAWPRDEVQALCIATPQPIQAQAGAVPLTDEQIKEVMDLVSDWGMQSHLRGEAELDAHNPEATEDEITYAKECAEKERAAWNAIKDKLKPHGIKGGQHGPA